MDVYTYYNLISQNRCPSKAIPESSNKNQTKHESLLCSYLPLISTSVNDLPLLARPRVISGIVNLHQRPVLSFLAIPRPFSPLYFLIFYFQ